MIYVNVYGLDEAIIAIAMTMSWARGAYEHILHIYI